MQDFYPHFSMVKMSDWKWPNFTPKEIACKGTGELVVDYDGLNALQEFRKIIGKPFSPNSAYRSASHNAKVGGAKNSYHRKGNAFDIPIKSGITRAAIHEAAKKAGFKGIIDYNTFVHIDRRSTHYYGDSRK